MATVHWDVRSELGEMKTVTTLRAVQEMEVSNALFLTEEEIHTALNLFRKKIIFHKLGKRSKSFFYSPIELTLPE